MHSAGMYTDLNNEHDNDDHCDVYNVSKYVYDGNFDDTGGVSESWHLRYRFILGFSDVCLRVDYNPFANAFANPDTIVPKSRDMCGRYCLGYSNL